MTMRVKMNMIFDCIIEPSSYIMINDSCSSALESKALKGFGLCIRFLYRMPSKSEAVLSVSNSEAHGWNTHWKLTGYHGDDWKKGHFGVFSMTGKKVSHFKCS